MMFAIGFIARALFVPITVGLWMVVKGDVENRKEMGYDRPY